MGAPAKLSAMMTEAPQQNAPPRNGHSPPETPRSLWDMLVVESATVPSTGAMSVMARVAVTAQAAHDDPNVALDQLSGAAIGELSKRITAPFDVALRKALQQIEDCSELGVVSVEEIGAAVLPVLELLANPFQPPEETPATVTPGGA